MKREQLHNIWVINLGILLVSLLLIAKLAYIQFAQGDFYKDKAERQYITPVATSFDRGSIFFTEKTGRKISAAVVVPDYTLAIDPSLVKDPEGLAEKLSSIISFDKADFIAHAKVSHDRYHEVAKHLNEDEINKINDLKDKSIVVKKDKRRSYPIPGVASQVIGFVGSNGEELTGRYGLERYYNETLRREGDDSSSSFFADLFLKPGKAILSNREREGDIVTTIEPTVQSMLERTLSRDVLEKYSAALAMGIIMNPKTGEIYAMAQAPTFDLNNFSKEKDSSVFANQLVEGVYEMGSIIKPLTVGAGIDTGVITAYTTYDDKGFRIINGKKISNFDGKGRGVIPIQEVLNQSLNTGTIFTMERLGKDRFKQYFTSYGLGEETGIDLPNEGVGLLSNLATGRDVEYATASFGQGISLTPIATIRALATLANGGTLVTPHIVKRTEYALGLSQDFVPGGERRVVSKETATEVTRMLTKSFDEALLGGSMKQEHYQIAAKTGTAQQVEGGVYSDTNFLHTFVGYFPSSNPQFIVFLAVKNPRGEAFSSHTLTPSFMQITKFLLNYYEVPPDR